MSGKTLIELMRGGWIVLACLMLSSRVIFQAVGAVRMRAFLNEWQDGTTKRLWGAASLLLAVLLADGLVNVLPAGFRTFKDRMQAAWVARARGTGREGDRHLFGTVNALLAAGSVAVLAVVLGYRPVQPATVAVAVAVAAVTLAVLVVPPLRRTR